MTVGRLLRAIDLRVLGKPKKKYAPDEVKPRWLWNAKDEAASVRRELDELRQRVERLESDRGRG